MKIIRKILWYLLDGQFDLLTIGLWTGFSISILSIDRSRWNGSLFHVYFENWKIVEVDILYTRVLIYNLRQHFQQEAPDENNSKEV